MRTMNILVIDDDANIRKLLQEMLSARPEYRVLIAADGKQAVRFFAEEKIDVVLTDIHMPGFTGLELMSDMLKLKFRPEILVMTANATPENVEKARKIGARSVILKPFDNLDVVEAEIEKAARAVLEATAAGTNGGGDEGQAEGVVEVEADQLPGPGSQTVRLPMPETPAAPPPRPHAASKPSPPPTPARAAGRAAPSVQRRPAAIPVSAPHEETSVPEPAESIPDFDAWKGDLSGNETPPPRPAPPPPPRPPAAAAPKPPLIAAQKPPVASVPRAPVAAAPKPPAAAAAPRATVTTPAAATPPTPRPAHPRPEVAATRPAPPPAAPAPAAVEEAEPGPSGSVEPHAEAIPAMPTDLEDIFRMVASLDVAKMQIQVPIICLQTWEERGALVALQKMATSLKRDFYTWSAARGILKDHSQQMGEIYRDPARALEFIRRQKNLGLYMLADFRQCLEDRMVVRVLREMVMEMETTRALLVITAPRLPVPPELAPACATFDWPGGGAADLEALYEEVMGEVIASSGQPVRLDRPTRDALLARVKEMPAGRARFEIARALMALLKRAS